MTSIRIPSPLQPYVGGCREVQISGNTVQEIINNLAHKHPRLAIHLLTDDGSLRPYVHIYRNDTNVFELDGLQTIVEKSDRLMIVPSIAGGYIKA